MKTVVSFALLLCVIRPQGLAAKKNFNDLERVCVPKKPRFPFCRRPCKDNDHRCVVKRDSDGDLYSNGLDMLALSGYIYELAALRKVAKKQDTALEKRLRVSKRHPKDFASLHRILHDADNQDAIVQEGDDEKDAVATLSTYNSHDASHRAWKSRFLNVFADDDESIRESRVHGIAVNKQRKRVEVVFRGTSNVSFKNAWYDWTTNVKALFKRSEENPVQDQKDALPKIKLHRGFANVVLGKKNDKVRPIDKILEEDVKPLMKRGYRLYVSGHSLGGATATLFGFYAACDPEITKYGPVTLLTFASPRVGGIFFRDAFMRLEESGRIRHGRFHNVNDKVAMVPYVGGKYKHVGMEMRLRPDDPPKVDYPVFRDWKQSGKGVVEHIVSMRGLLSYHSTEEIMRRMRAASPAFGKTSLEDEYRTMWGVSSRE